MKNLDKNKRQEKLLETIEKDPFLTDEELADYFGVSIQTIRLDRMELNIPEVRKRIKNLAQSAYENLKSVKEGEVIGELIKLDLESTAESYLVTTEEMALQDSNVIRGHHIFAQANSLAVAVIDANLVLTGQVDMKYIKPVYIKERIKAKAVVTNVENDKYYVDINSYSKGEKVFWGNFIMFAQQEEVIAN